MSSKCLLTLFLFWLLLVNGDKFEQGAERITFLTLFLCCLYSSVSLTGEVGTA